MFNSEQLFRLPSTSGVSNSNGLGGRIRSVRVLAGHIQYMKTASGRQESLIENLINYIMIQYLNKQKEMKKPSSIMHKELKKPDYFLIFIQFTVFNNCWGAVMNPLAGRIRPAGCVFEMPDLHNTNFIRYVGITGRSIITRPNTFPKKNPLPHDIWSNKFCLSSVDSKVTRVLTQC